MAQEYIKSRHVVLGISDKAICEKDQAKLTWWVEIVTSPVGYATHVRTKPLLIWSSSRKDWSLWSTSPLSTLPAQLEQAPARQLYGKSSPASSAASRMYVSPAIKQHVNEETERKMRGEDYRGVCRLRIR